MQAPPIQSLPLRDIKLPAEPGFWPLAPGWWVVIVLLLLLLIWAAVKGYQYNRKKRRWLQIDQQLSKLEFSFQQSNNKQELLTEISMFLRRFVKFQLKQNTASSLAGHAWITHLDQYQPGTFTKFETALTQGVFESACDYDPHQLLHVTRDFIKKQVMRPNKTEALGDA